MWGNELNKRRDAMPSDATPDTTPFWYPFDFFPGLRIIIYIFPLLQKKTDPVLMRGKSIYKYTKRIPDMAIKRLNFGMVIPSVCIETEASIVPQS